MLDFTVLDALDIKNVFVGCGIEELLNTISKTEDYLTILFDGTTHKTLWVTDDTGEGHCVFVTDTNGINKDKLLKIINKQSKSLFLWRIDGVMFEHLSKCDCGILHDKILHLIEFKANVTTDNPESLHEHYEKAQTQLKLTFDRFKELYSQKGIEIFDILDDIDAQIVFDRTIPYDNAYLKNLKDRFLDENEIILSWGNELVVE